MVSVLFVDLVGFTAGSDRADPEDVRATLRPYHARVSREIERFGGTVEKFVGDAVMAVFGAPVAHEDDRRARRPRGPPDPRRDPGALGGRGPGARRPRCGRDGRSGRTARRTAGHGRGHRHRRRRQHRCAPAGSCSCRRPRGRRADVPRHAPADPYEELPALEVKGKGDPVSCLASAARRRAVSESTRKRRLPTPFVGRDRELRLLQDMFERMVGESEIQLVTVTGEPGVGKTRLLARVPGLGRRPARARVLATGQVPPLRRRHHVLGARRDRQGTRRHPRVRRACASRGEARPSPHRSRTTPSGCRRAWAHWWASWVAARRDREESFAPGSASSSRLPAEGRSSFSSRTSTGPTRRSSSSSSASSTGRRACRSSCSARDGPSSTRAIRHGAAASATRLRSRYRPCRKRTLRCSWRLSST